MLKASALYMVIVIALVIALICSSLIVTAYFYRLQYQKNFRHNQLENNLESAENILLAGDDNIYNFQKSFSLFNGEADTVSTERLCWGLYDVGIAKAMIQKDTLYSIFSIANTLDSSKWAAIYLSDNSRPLSLSGKTSIVGNAFISPAGLTQAYVNNQAYTGDKRLILGEKHNSEKSLPLFDTNRLKQLQQFIQQNFASAAGLPNADSINNSFLNPTRIINLKQSSTTLKNLNLSGNIIIVSDTSLTIDSTVKLNNVIVIAKSITVQSGFHGRCQLFAHDTIGVQHNCIFNYPSTIAVLRFDKSPLVNTSEKISLNENCIFSGYLFNYGQDKSALPALISIGKKTKISGQVYSQGYTEFADQAEIDGSVFTDRFLYQSPNTRFENYLINATINSKLLSPYYLSSTLFPVSSPKKKVLQWLESK